MSNLTLCLFSEFARLPYKMSSNLKEMNMTYEKFRKRRRVGAEIRP